MAEAATAAGVSPLTLVILGDKQQLWPGEDMIEVVLHLVVLREAPQVRRLHLDEVIHGCLAYGKGHGRSLNQSQRSFPAIGVCTAPNQQAHAGKQALAAQ